MLLILYLQATLSYRLVESPNGLGLCIATVPILAGKFVERPHLRPRRAWSNSLRGLWLPAQLVLSEDFEHWLSPIFRPLQQTRSNDDLITEDVLCASVVSLRPFLLRDSLRSFGRFCWTYLVVFRRRSAVGAKEAVDWVA